MITDNSFAGLFYLLSIIFTAVGFVVGVFFMVTQLSQGIIMIMVAALGGGLFFGLGKILQLLNDIKAGGIISFDSKSENNSKEKNDNSKEEKNEEKESVKQEKEEVKEEEEEVPYNVPVKWELTNKQKANIVTYYFKDNQKVLERDIIVTPFKGYCVIKTNRFIDVIELLNDNPITLKRDQVENFKELHQWIEENVFRKPRK